MWTKSTPEFYAFAAGLSEAGMHISDKRVTFSTKDQEIPRDLQNVFGGTINRSAFVEIGGPATYRWNLTEPADIQKFLQTIVPYLHPNRKAEVQDALADLYEKEKTNAR